MRAGSQSLRGNYSAFFAGLSGLLRRTRGLSAGCPYEPSFTPVGINRTRAQSVIFRFADHSIQDDAWIFHSDQLAGFFVNDLVNPSQHPVDTATIWKHF